jgi:hypothetical protein
MLLLIIEQVLLIQKLDEKEEVQLERYIDKNELVELECDQIDLLLEKNEGLHLVLEIQ